MQGAAAVRVAGAAMGLVKEGDNYVILTDIACGDQLRRHGFQGRSTREGITALQMTSRSTASARRSWSRALAQARRRACKILDCHGYNLAKPRPNISTFAPRIFTIRINKDKIREVIGRAARYPLDHRETDARLTSRTTRINIASVDESSALKATRSRQRRSLTKDSVAKT